jgi:hypothetical protein
VDFRVRWPILSIERCSLRTPMYETDARAFGYVRVKRQPKYGLQTRGNHHDASETCKVYWDRACQKR